MFFFLRNNRAKAVPKVTCIFTHFSYISLHITVLREGVREVISSPFLDSKDKGSNPLYGDNETVKSLKESIFDLKESRLK